MNIITENIHPPIPTRNYDWQAYVEGQEEGACGYGATKQEAIADLMEQNEEA